MGKPTGFMDYQRQLAPDRQSLLRTADWQDFHGHLDPAQQQIQGARCMNCGIPFCHAGIRINGAASGCPIHNLIPEWNDLIFRGRWREAWQRLMKTNNFPEFTGRVCPAPCEGACTAGMHDQPITIKANERAIIDYAWSQGWIQPEPPPQRTGQTVAVVGSGPAGLACADQLNRAGHTVSVFERADRIGGLLMYGIPNMKLDKHLVQRRIDLMADEGIMFRTGCEIGRDQPVEALCRGFSAVVLCCGAAKARDLSVTGRTLHGIHFAVDYLHENTKHLLDDHTGNRPGIDARSLDVIVIGGGDTGTDCVGTAIRQGCRSVTQLEIMPPPPLTRGISNPWPQWPHVLRTDYGQEEAVAHFGSDPRVYLTTVQAFSGGATGHVQAVKTVQIKWEHQERQRPVPRPVSGSERQLPAQLVLLAMGFLGPEDHVINQLQLARDSRTNVLTDPVSWQTSCPGVFAAGDMRQGQSLVVWAIQEGRAVARACDIWLTGHSLLSG